MKRQIKTWVQSCDKCQRCKIHRHTKAPLGTFALPDARFAHIHIDFIGPLPPSDGKLYCMTIVDRFTRWPEVIPTSDMTALTTAKSIVQGWISRFGCPVSITTDQGRNFESALLRELTNILGCNRIHTTAYHPIANGMAERFHRCLKTAITTYGNTNWTETLPLVLLGLRTAIKNDIQASSAELVYGTTLRLPADLFTTDNCNTSPDPTYVSQLCESMRKLSPLNPISHGHTNVYVHPSLSSCSHVFLRVDNVRPPLTPPYTGPYAVIERNDKTFVIKINNKSVTVSLDRLKPAFYLSESPSQSYSQRQTSKNSDESKIQSKMLVPKEDKCTKIITTRSGRRVHFPKHLTTVYC